MFLIHNISKNDAFWINVNFRGIFSEPIRSKIGNSRKRNYLPWKSYFGKTKVIFVFSGPIYIRKVKQDPVYRTHPKICYPVLWVIFQIFYFIAELWPFFTFLHYISSKFWHVIACTKKVLGTWFFAYKLDSSCKNSKKNIFWKNAFFDLLFGFSLFEGSVNWYLRIPKHIVQARNFKFWLSPPLMDTL